MSNQPNICINKIFLQALLEQLNHSQNNLETFTLRFPSFFSLQQCKKNLLQQLNTLKNHIKLQIERRRNYQRILKEKVNDNQTKNFRNVKQKEQINSQFKDAIINQSNQARKRLFCLSAVPLKQHFRITKESAFKIGNQSLIDQLIITSDKKKITYKVSESKNIIKNFTRAMLTDALRYSSKTGGVLSKLGIQKQPFFNYIKQIRDRIHSISALRELWMQETNKYAKALRMISFYFLRKKHLYHALNSKIKNVEKNIKYRQKLLEGLKDPKSFTLMRQF